jgi:hypothetical protein
VVRLPKFEKENKKKRRKPRLHLSSALLFFFLSSSFLQPASQLNKGFVLGLKCWFDLGSTILCGIHVYQNPETSSGLEQLGQ